MKKTELTEPCPCGSAKDFEKCCQPYLSGAVNAPSPEALMRSRFCAFYSANVDYLIDTLHSSKRQPNDRQSLMEHCQQTEWFSLRVVKSAVKGLQGEVEFIAYFQQGGSVGQHQEHSQFVNEGGKWFYLEGKFKTGPLQLGRNDLCWCGSGKKYKKCHAV